MAINNCTFMGRLTADPEIRTTESQKSVTTFTIAIDRGDKQKTTDFITCVAWEQRAEFICRYFGKGSMIAVEGSMQSRNYKDRDDKKRTAIECLVRKVSFTGEKSRTAAQKEPEPDFSTIEDDGDLPF